MPRVRTDQQDESGHRFEDLRISTLRLRHDKVRNTTVDDRILDEREYCNDVA